MDTPHISIVAALGEGRVIGKDNRLLWHVPEDLRRFKALTLGHPVIMGRKTFDSIVETLGKPLPERTSIVVTRSNPHDPNFAYEGVIALPSIEAALASAKALDREEVFVIGGAQIYELALPYTDRLYLTLVDDPTEGDTYFPEYEKEFGKKIAAETHGLGGLTYTWVTLQREPPTGM